MCICVYMYTLHNAIARKVKCGSGGEKARRSKTATFQMQNREIDRKGRKGWEEGNQSFASSFTEPIFSFGAYFFSTPSLWYCNGTLARGPRCAFWKLVVLLRGNKGGGNVSRVAAEREDAVDGGRGTSPSRSRPRSAHPQSRARKKQ